MMKDLETLSGFLKQKFPSATNMPSLRVVDDNSTAACPAGQVMKVLSGAGSELERTMCGKCFLKAHNNSQIIITSSTKRLKENSTSKVLVEQSVSLVDKSNAQFGANWS